mgnify:CR=1 FL=1
MKKIILLFFLLSGTIPLHGQEYVPLLDTNKVWNTFEEYFSHTKTHNHSRGATYPYYLERCEIDTTRFIIKKKLPGQVSAELGYLTEDTITRKVFYTDMYGGEEMLLYDFNLVAGDSFYYSWVIEVDSIQLLDGTYRKRIVFDDGYNSWIEGIGNSWGGLLWLEWDIKQNLPAYAILLCHYENDTLLYFDDRYGTCNYNYTQNNAETLEKSITPIIYPNPFSQKLSILLERVNGQRIDLIIKTLDGRQVFNATLNSENSLDLSFLSKGIYLLVLTNRDFQYTTKIIKL